MEEREGQAAEHPEHHPSVLEVDVHHHTELPSTRISDGLDGLLRRIGDFFSWFWLAVVGVILVSVISRYVFARGSVTMEEIQWHIYGAVWLVGLAYALVSDDHVRVDIFHERFGLRAQTWIELAGILLLLLPFLVIGFLESAPYFYSSYTQGEESQAPAGLPYRWAVKFFLPVAFALLILGSVSRLLKCTALLFGVPKPTRKQRKPVSRA
ncbi:MAG: TRAP transporter small permease subunit [Gammaproteobacteria bacterium]|nr:TRAP transporter small permease subunit [Gammaproteobacteria bacterium]NIR85821.1 TRAP transporter small permease subunit [Gammaproteobacteria bacterium]NIR90575.1 TRAP transporter small permease subunit [Gammaproteobacteria bacterium]NIU06956.1 TRAP transporter small permease subunit [Gammaproteobacteria bacterium]NIV53886.1 TRAP transporter small permease subunit [Gammaproteobacteria bacterium]